MKCDFCDRENLRLLCSPINTKRLAKVYICKNCTLLQSEFKKKNYKKIISPSCDADWGNIRHGKALNLLHGEKILKKIARKQSNIENVLDIGSSRGHFLKEVPRIFPNFKTVVGVEPDRSVIPEKNLFEKNIKILPMRLEEAKLDDEYFDFVFSSHSLEHSESATKMMEITYRLMRNNAILYLETPNLKNIEDKFIIEEFFIDKHTFHFSEKTLMNLCNKINFTKIKDFSDNYNLKFVLQKISNPKIIVLGKRVKPTNYNNYFQIYRKVKSYRKRLIKNRRFLKYVSQKIIDESKKNKTLIFGSGRILDAMVKYGNLKLNKNLYLVDTFLSQYLKNFCRKKIYKIQQIKKIKPNSGFIFARSSSKFIQKTLKVNGVKKHYLFFKILKEKIKNAI